MLRIHFAASDLARIRIAPGPDPLWESMLSMHVLMGRDTDPLHDGWKQDRRKQLAPASVQEGQLATIFALNPPLGYFPDFLTPKSGESGLDAGLEAILATPAKRLRAEVSQVCDARPTAARLLDDLRQGKTNALTTLTAQLRTYHDIAVRPLWARIYAASQADRDLRSRQMADGGLGAMLDNLVPQARFRDNVLEMYHFRREFDLHLEGRGLVMIPSYFKVATTLMVLADPRLAPVIVYPIRPDIRVTSDLQRAAIGDLIGHTRAAVLEEAIAGAPVSHIARSLQISQPSATKHLAVLRTAGLLSASREGRATRHVLTALGHSLLRGAR